MTEEFQKDCKPCGILLPRLSTDKLTQICKPCTVLLEKLPDPVILTGLSERQIAVKRLDSAQKHTFQKADFEGKRLENAKEKAKKDRNRKIAMQVTQRSARRRGRGRPPRRPSKQAVKNPIDTPSQGLISSERNKHCHLFSAYSEMLVTLSPGGEASFLMTEEESYIVASLLDLPNPIRSKMVEFTARSPGWVRVDSEEICFDWLERLVEAGIIHMATNYPSEYPDILNVLTIPELKLMCKRAGLSSHFSKQSLIRELTITQYFDVKIFEVSPESNEIYDMRRIVRLADPVRQLIIKTAHMFLLPIKDSKPHWAESNPIYKIVRPCLPLNPELRSIKFDGYLEIFQDKEELFRWVQARREKFYLLKAIVRKKWEVVKNILLDVSVRQLYVPPNQSMNDGPDILRQLSAKNVEIETLSLGVEALLSSNTTLELAEEVLHLLLRQSDRSPEEKCSWRYQLALRFEKASKPEKVADMALHARKLACENCEICQTKLPQLCKRISLSENLPLFVTSKLIDCANNEELFQPKIIAISRRSTRKGFPGLKSVYGVIKNGTRLHLSVEEYVMEHFVKNGYPKGLDDEGRTIINLGYLTIWEETYSKDIPKVFCAPWQSVPLDWGTREFWLARKSQLEAKFLKVSEMTSDQLSDYLEEKRNLIGRVCGTVHWNFDNIDLKGMLSCLTVPLFIAICRRVISSGFIGRRGFPDLFLWNEKEKTSLFVEVKGPKDKLSSPQRSWLEFLRNLQVEALVAEVHD